MENKNFEFLEKSLCRDIANIIDDYIKYDIFQEHSKKQAVVVDSLKGCFSNYGDDKFEEIIQKAKDSIERYYVCEYFWNEDEHDYDMEILDIDFSSTYYPYKNNFYKKIII